MTSTLFSVLGDTAEFTLLLMCTGEDGCPADPYHLYACPEFQLRPRGANCACGFPSVTEAGDVAASDPAWAHQHATFHLHVFPRARDDIRTVRNLLDIVVEKTERQRGCKRHDVYGPKVEGSTVRTRMVTCVQHDGEIHQDQRDTAVHTFADAGREPWIAHVLNGRAL